MKPGYIYVLTHPSNPDLYKIGVTILEPTKRLAQHNSDFTRAAGRVVNETGQKWELKELPYQTSIGLRKHSGRKSPNRTFLIGVALKLK